MLISLLVLALLVVLFNVLKGKPQFPEDYYRKAKAPVTWKQKINPYWWMLNDDDPVLPVDLDNLGSVKNDWFKTTWPQWARQIAWGWRNPTCNFDRYVVGFWDAYHMWGRNRFDTAPPEWNGKDTMWPIPGKRLNVAAPWFSFWFNISKTRYCEGYAGWKPNGEFGWISVRFKKGQV